MTINRRTYGLCALASGAFLAYGSLIPFSFEWLPFSQAVALFRHAVTSPMTIDARTDFVTNILLTVPLGYLLLAALRTDRIGRPGDALAAVVAFVLSVSLSIGVEFAQNFFPGRTDSLSDIVAQTIGAVVGTTGWLLFGRAATSWLRETLAERHGPAFAQRALLVYSLLYAISQLIPLDLTINLGELASKYRSGGIQFVPFAWQYASNVDRAWDMVSDMALNIPLGAAGVFLGTVDGFRRRPWRAFVVSAAAVIAIEIGQIFVHSRIADATDVLTGLLGVLLGVAGTTALSHSAERPRVARDAGGFWWARCGVVVMAALLASYHWNPFNFTTSSGRINEGMHQLFSVPLSTLYIGTEFHAFTEMWRKVLLALPMGVFLHLSWRSGGRVPSAIRFAALAAIGGAVALGIEVGQVFLPTRVPDLTDVLLAELGVVAGLWLTSRVARATVHPHAHASEPRGLDAPTIVPPG